MAGSFEDGHDGHNDLHICRQVRNGASRARTDDLLAASQTLFQLSYSPESAINPITLEREKSDLNLGA